MYDIVGDIHGHADELVRLLERLGYDRRAGYYQHPTRKVIFVGDLIDRGPQIREVLQIVRPMHEQGSALVVLGNHELNALAYHTRRPSDPDQFCRPHIEKNIQQHWETLRQLSPLELNSALDWFRSLPMWLEVDGLRVVHACWDDDAIRTIQELHTGDLIAPKLLEPAFIEGTSEFTATEAILKGKEIKLPDGITQVDKDGHRRTKLRIRWFESPEGQTYRSWSIADLDLPEEPLPDSAGQHITPYPLTAPPVFCGHYWLNGEPRLLAPNVCCLDFSVAKGGRLVAYRWNGEPTLSPDQFVSVESVS